MSNAETSGYGINQVTVGREGSRFMRKLALAAVVIAWGAGSQLALAHDGRDHPVVAGNVTKVDASAGQVTIAHEAIPNLEMESMTMVFKASDPAMLQGLKRCDAIKFTADKVNGELTVTEIDKAG